MLSKFKQKSKKGFTLVELIVVIAIIAILAAVAIPTTLHFVEKAKISSENQTISGVAGSLQDALASSTETTLDVANLGDFIAAAIGDYKSSVGSVIVKITNYTDANAQCKIQFVVTGAVYGTDSQASTPIIDISPKAISATANKDYVYTWQTDGWKLPTTPAI